MGNAVLESTGISCARYQVGNRFSKVLREGEDGVHGGELESLAVGGVRGVSMTAARGGLAAPVEALDCVPGVECG
jgi:hypothetical protein